MQRISDQFFQDTGHKIRLSFGSSGNFTRQIRQGAPYELFLSADESFIFALADAGYIENTGKLYAIGRLALAIPAHVDPDKIESLESQLRQIAHLPKAKFAIANPEHAPYGTRSREVLEHFNLWQQLKPKLVLGENVAQAAQFALSPNTEGGLIALSLARAPKLIDQGFFVSIPTNLHEAINHRMVLLPGASDITHSFHDYLLSDKARLVFQEAGFSVPADLTK